MYCRHSHLNQPRFAFVCVEKTNNKNVRFFHSHLFLPETNFLPGIKNSSLSESNGTRLRNTDLDCFYQFFLLINVMGHTRVKSNSFCVAPVCNFYEQIDIFCRQIKMYKLISTLQKVLVPTGTLLKKMIEIKPSYWREQKRPFSFSALPPCRSVCVISITQRLVRLKKLWKRRPCIQLSV